MHDSWPTLCPHRLLRLELRELEARSSTRACPRARWLEHYARHFDTVEVNNTFYRLPNRDAVANWERTVPPGFLFTIKASRYLTHVKRLLDLGAGPRPLLRADRAASAQPEDGPDPLAAAADLQARRRTARDALARLPREQRHCFEFRHPSWFADDVYALLREHGVALVIGDRPEVKPFQSHVFTATLTFVRFHYGSRGRRGNYSETELQEWADRFADWSSEIEIFAYFNNDWEVFAVRNALRLKQLLGATAGASGSVRA